MRYEIIEGVEEIFGGAYGKKANSEEILGEVNGMGSALNDFISTLMQIFAVLKSFFDGSK